MTEWKAVPEFPLYEVSKDGNIRSYWKRERDDQGCFHCVVSPTPTLMKPGFRGRGYPAVTLHTQDNSVAWFYVHDLVAALFIRPKPDGMTVNHKNGVKTDNQEENLEYVTYAENNRHALRTGLNSLKGEANPQAKLTEQKVREIKRLIGSVRQCQIAEQFGVSESAVCLIAKGINWSHVK